MNADNVFNNIQRKEKANKDAMAQEAARHTAVIENMHRLKALRLAAEKDGQNK
jgi:hypothetical protein